MKQTTLMNRVSGAVGPVKNDAGRRGSRRLERLTALPLALASLLAAGPAAAQSSSRDGEFSVQRFDPAPGPRNFFSTRGARIDGKMAWSAGLVLNYSNSPFTVVSCQTATDCSSPSAQPSRRQDVDVVKNLFTADLMGSLTPIERLQIGLRVPLSYVNGDGIQDDGLPQRGGIKGVALGDPMVEAKVRAYGEVKDPIVIGAALFATAPLGHATAEGKFVGDQTPIIGLRGIFDGKQGPFSFAANLAGLYRGTGRIGSTELGSEFRYGVAGGFEASPVVRLIVDGFGGTKFSSKNGTNSLEIDGGAVVTPLASGISVLGGIGFGVIEGVGVPSFRGFVGIGYVKESRDRDGDGFPDGQDQCPTEAEDKDGYEDNDGCPDRDNDGDGIPDDSDKCSTQAEDVDGFQDADGCPDPDNDNDGVLDGQDQCPDKQETKNGFRDEDGCPDEPDADGDGVPDSKDKCPDKAEDTDGFQDTDGCPDPDNDGDGINDEDDECVDEPEDKDGFQDQDGCPDEGGKIGKAPAKAAAPAAAPAPAKK